ncbi:MAG: isoprenylcysteine carboxylmethyltransferase family protein [Anaerolineae bacterium]|nr:isoprenylcysteine carboxylmethyltransferase family protein [Anaerolineae bacterium]
MFDIVMFVVGSTGILLLSRQALRNMHSHGFYRFFAFELLLILLLMNRHYWFDEPFALPQILSWILLSVSLVFAVQGFSLLRNVGEPGRQIESTIVLVQVGIYKYIRHPLYSSLMLFGWGVFFKQLSKAAVILTALATVFLLLTAKVEEGENTEKFGEAYTTYMAGTKRFFPYIF